MGASPQRLNQPSQNSMHMRGWVRPCPSWKRLRAAKFSSGREPKLPVARTPSSMREPAERHASQGPSEVKKGMVRPRSDMRVEIVRRYPLSWAYEPYSFSTWNMSTLPPRSSWWGARRGMSSS